MTSASAWAIPLIEPLDLAHPPVAITFGTQPAASGDGTLSPPVTVFVAPGLPAPAV
ncbi:hypothetical protein [Streptomyces fagopyri]|uniref:hypothetical protein n=1 Tax=Streptomyces fagopyri TaxID=2662397 RepID=UPI003720C7D5